MELVYFSGCPSVPEVRRNLRLALLLLGRSPMWTEWDIEESEAPERVRGYPSPTLLQNGVELFGEEGLDSELRACSASTPSFSDIALAIEFHTWKRSA